MCELGSNYYISELSFLVTLCIYVHIFSIAELSCEYCRLKMLYVYIFLYFACVTFASLSFYLQMFYHTAFKSLGIHASTVDVILMCFSTVIRCH